MQELFVEENAVPEYYPCIAAKAPDGTRVVAPGRIGDCDAVNIAMIFVCVFIWFWLDKRHGCMADFNVLNKKIKKRQLGFETCQDQQLHGLFTGALRFLELEVRLGVRLLKDWQENNKDTR